MEIMVPAGQVAVVSKSGDEPKVCFCCGADLPRKIRVDTAPVEPGEQVFTCECGEARHTQHYQHDGRLIRPGKRVCPGCGAQSSGPGTFREVKPKAA